jgi:hypothetical protein
MFLNLMWVRLMNFVDFHFNLTIKILQFERRQ